MPAPATPRARGFRWPAEWEPHEATLLAWPHDPTTFAAGLEPAERAVATFAAAVSRGERVDLLVADGAMEDRARRALAEADAGNVRLWRVPTADVWIRDYGPTVLVAGEGAARRRLFVDFVFNAWGGKYEALRADDGVPERLAALWGVERARADLVLEGGSIDGDGQGTLLTTEQCLLHENRNPGMDRADLERALGDWLGVERVLWLGAGIAGDDTDGHVDDLARFVAPGRVVAAVQPDPADPDHAALAENRARLGALRDARGRPLEVLELPMPAPCLDARGARLPASHANFYVCNAAVCVPVFGSPTDEVALRLLARCFPDRAVVPIRCEHLVVGFGALHCASQQLPA